MKIVLEDEIGFTDSLLDGSVRFRGVELWVRGLFSGIYAFIFDHQLYPRSAKKVSQETHSKEMDASSF